MLLVLTTLLVIVSAQLGLSLDIDEKSENNPVVTTKNGKVLGAKFRGVRDDFPYYAFQGIPFAEPPIGERRFMPPQTKKNWSGVLNATKDIPICMQPKIKTYGDNISEDCLVLNVYTPNLNGSLSVMVNIYGGGFIGGSASKRIYGPDFLISENVVLVVPNYRLGVFGFLSTQDKVAPGNNGLKDQIKALEWVRENIAAFGGNPDNVTIFGESAGSASVSLLLQAKIAKGLFHAAIMQSGVSLSLFSRTRNPLQVAHRTAKILGINASNNEELLNKLRGVSSTDLLEASAAAFLKMVNYSNPLNELFYSPTIEPVHPGAILTEYSYEALKKGHFNKVPIMVGFNSAEGNAFEAATRLYFGALLLLQRSESIESKLVPSSMNVKEHLHDKVGKEIKTFYYGAKNITSSALQTSRYITDDQFIRPTLEMVRLVSPVISTYLYEFSYVGSDSIASRKLPGVQHAEDVKYLWYSQQLNEKDTITSKRLVKLWTNFAKHGNPTPSKTKLLNDVTWRTSNKVDIPFLQINTTLYMSENPRKKSFDFWLSLFNKYGNPPYDTY